MTSYHPALHEVFRTDPYEVAMPYRSDGVARALQATFVADTVNLPREMLELLAALDAARLPATTQNLDLIDDRIEHGNFGFGVRATRRQVAASHNSF